MKPHIVRNKLLRKRVFERDGGICADCGRYDAKWEHDHDVPLWSGGRDDLDNSVTRCRACHLKKTTGETPVRAKTDRLRERHDLTLKRKGIHP
jgi:5-methylcytosine-specific restriction endonuclease McrA